jgi:hypothetical protein
MKGEIMRVTQSVDAISFLEASSSSKIVVDGEN